MTRRFVQTYFETLPGGNFYSTFDWATRDADGYYFVLGSYRRRDQRRRSPPRHAGNRGGGAGAPGNRRSRGRGCCGSGEGSDSGGLRGGQGSLAASPPRERYREMRAEVMSTVDRKLGAIARPGHRAFRHAAAQDAFGQAFAARDSGTGRRSRSGRSDDDRGSGGARAIRALWIRSIDQPLPSGSSTRRYPPHRRTFGCASDARRRDRQHPLRIGRGRRPRRPHLFAAAATRRLPR